MNCNDAQCHAFEMLPGHANAAAGSAAPQDKAKAIKRIANLFVQRKLDKLEELTAPDAFVYVQGPESLPFSGRFVGQQCVRQALSRLEAYLRIVAIPEVYHYLNESGSEFVAFDFEMEATQDPSIKLRSSVAMKVKVNDDGRLIKVAVISDTLAAAQALAQSEVSSGNLARVLPRIG